MAFRPGRLAGRRLRPWTNPAVDGGKVKSDKLAAAAAKIAAAVLVLAIVSSGCGGSTAEVEVTRVSPRSIEETVMVAGSLQSSNTTQVIPQVSGPVSQVLVAEGQQVTAGQPLVQLDTSTLEQQLLSAMAGLESIQSLSSMFASLSSTASGISSAINSALGSVDSSVFGLYNLQKMLIPALPEDQRLVALQAIEASYNAYQAKASNRPSFGGGGGGGSTSAQQASANQAIANARKNIQAATVTAPTSGTVVNVQGGGSSINSLMSTLMSSFSGMLPSGLNLSSLTSMAGGFNIGMPTSGPVVVGAYVGMGTPIFSIVDLKNMSLMAKVDETDIAKISPNQPARVTLEAYPGKTYEATVAKVADTATTNEAGATAFEVTVLMNTSDVNLKIGMTGTADVTIATKEAAAVVPIDAIVEKQGKKYVFKVVDGKADLTAVTLGLSTDDRVEVIKGVKIGDTVVARGVEKLKDGQGVKQ